MVRDNGTGSAVLDHMVLDRFDVDDLDSDTINAYRNTLSAVRPGHPWLALDEDQFLLRLGATATGEDEEQHPTRAGLLMFGHEWKITQEFPYYFLDYREISDGVRRWDHRIVSGDGEWSGNLYGFWLKTWPLLAQSVRRPFDVDDEMRRMDDTPLHLALREALANTLIHADYYMRGNTVIVNGADSVSFTNPGGLRMPPDVALAGGLSDSRNPTLLKMFALISVVERAGSGFDAMRSGCEWAHLPCPELTESFDPDRTRLVFRLESVAKRTSHMARIQTVLKPDSINTAQSGKAREHEVILAYLHNARTITRAQVEQLTGMNTAQAKYMLKQLVLDGTVIQEGRGRATHYVLR
ncbi:hypothetical protein EMO92_11305 [Bifidobacterium reuteri]|uniref:Uncharacterized protein n=2 Tax=Bifidobacterium reuteri TaxID=983706 RepID=A0A5J5DZT6_9BIFI|nr:hypothetical protein EMO92_11305 [Bifidobacterium reuteri]